MRIGFFSCQDYQAGYYTALAGLAKEPDLDLIVCLGDYVYERTYYSGPPGRRDTLGANGDAEVQTLAEYRQKYRLYRTDADLQAIHSAAPFMAIWDDHEVEDDYASERPGEATAFAIERSLPAGHVHAVLQAVEEKSKPDDEIPPRITVWLREATTTLRPMQASRRRGWRRLLGAGRDSDVYGKAPGNSLTTARSATGRRPSTRNCSPWRARGLRRSGRVRCRRSAGHRLRRRR